MRRFPVLGLLVAGLVLPAAAPAALPKPEKTYSVHDHQTPGDNWHVEMKINKTGRQIVGLVLHAERCGKHTPFGTGIIIAEDGSTSANGPLDEDDPSAGSWGMRGRFTKVHRFEGEFAFSTPGCTTGPISFVAHSGKHGKHGKHAHKHAKGHRGRHDMTGTPMGEKPDFASATPRARRQAKRLWRGSLRAARTRFATYSAARARGFVPYRRTWDRSVLYHVRSAAYDADGVSFDPKRPESLVYWRSPGRRPVLVAFMFRRPVGPQPAFGRGILGWHSHSRAAGATQMTHVWLARRARAALANCMPVAALEADVPGFRFRMGAIGVGHESAPC